MFIGKLFSIHWSRWCMESCGALISLFFVCFFSITCCCGAAPTDLWFCSALQKKKKKWNIQQNQSVQWGKPRSGHWRWLELFSLCRQVFLFLCPPSLSVRGGKITAAPVYNAMQLNITATYSLGKDCSFSRNWSLKPQRMLVCWSLLY